MNCKPGDLAIIIKPGPNRDKIVQVIRALKEEDIGQTFHGIRLLPGEGIQSQVWYVEGNLTLWDKSQVPGWFWRDCWLRPIRDTDGTDETLTWAGKPKQLEKV